MHYEISYDISRFLDASIEKVVHTLFEAFVLVAIVQGLRAFTDMDAQQLLLGLSVICVVTMVVLFFWAESKSDKEEPESDKFDAFAGGYPVPPLPGQELPASTRHAVPAKSAKEVEK